MTCIVAIKEGNKIYMGADSAASGGDFSQRTRNDPKIYVVGGYMFGFTSSFRMGQLLGHSFIPPDRDPRVSLDKFMPTLFIDAVRKCLKEGGYATKESDAEVGGTFLVAFEGHLFEVYSDYQVAENILGYDAVGCGSEIAMGSLHTSYQHTVLYPNQRLEAALLAAEEFSAGVRGPFIYKEQVYE